MTVDCGHKGRKRGHSCWPDKWNLVPVIAGSRQSDKRLVYATPVWSSWSAWTRSGAQRRNAVGKAEVVDGLRVQAGRAPCNPPRVLAPIRISYGVARV